jgi:ribose transport system substrate-binding protein
MKKTLLIAVLVLVAATLVSAAPFRIALSNSFMGNDWRQEMEKVTQEVAKKDFFASQATLTIINCDNTPEAQSDSIDSLVKQGYNAILVDASSPTALNPAIDRAIAAGVVVVSFDQVVTNPGAWKIETDFNKIPRIQALYIAKAIDGKGDIVVDRGLPGAPISKQLEDGARAVFAEYPGIRIVAGYDGQYAQGPTLQGMNSILASQPNIDAVFTQGYTGPVIKALNDAGHAMVPMSGFDYNGDMLACVDNNVKVIIANNIPGLGAIAYKTAIDILNGGHPVKHMLIDPLFLSTDTSIDVGVPVEKIEVGVNTWRDMPYGFDWPVLPRSFPVQLTAQEAAVTQ